MVLGLPELSRLPRNKGSLSENEPDPFFPASIGNGYRRPSNKTTWTESARTFNKSVRSATRCFRRWSRKHWDVPPGRGPADSPGTRPMTPLALNYLRPLFSGDPAFALSCASCLSHGTGRHLSAMAAAGDPARRPRRNPHASSTRARAWRPEVSGDDRKALGRPARARSPGRPRRASITQSPLTKLCPFCRPLCVMFCAMTVWTQCLRIAYRVVATVRERHTMVNFKIR